MSVSARNHYKYLDSSWPFTTLVLLGNVLCRTRIDLVILMLFSPSRAGLWRLSIHGKFRRLHYVSTFESHVLMWPEGRVLK